MEPEKVNTMPWWRRCLISIYEDYLPEILRIFLQSLGITVPTAAAVQAGKAGQADQAVPKEKNLYAGEGPLQRGKKVGTVNAKTIFENSSVPTQRTLPSMPLNDSEYDNVFVHRGPTNLFVEADTINSETTFK